MSIVDNGLDADLCDGLGRQMNQLGQQPRKVSEASEA